MLAGTPTTKGGLEALERHEQNHGGSEVRSRTAFLRPIPGPIPILNPPNFCICRWPQSSPRSLGSWTEATWSRLNKSVVACLACVSAVRSLAQCSAVHCTKTAVSGKLRAVNCHPSTPAGSFVAEPPRSTHGGITTRRVHDLPKPCAWQRRIRRVHR